jgi:hypothetical protein
MDGAPDKVVAEHIATPQERKTNTDS